MTSFRTLPPWLAALAVAAGLASPAWSAMTVPVDYYKLPNGLKVVLSRDTTAPTAVVAVYYNIGFRIEPRDRTGFAHLFEHMMFQGSGNLGKMEFIKLVQKNGGVLNGSVDVCTFLLEEARIACVAGQDFGSDAHIRISYATGIETIREGMRRMDAAVRALGA